MQWVASVLPFIHASLGQSIIYEEYKGDFQQVRQIAERQLDDARRAGDTVSIADALLTRGVIHLLQGETPAARDCLDEVTRTVPGDAPRLLRAVSYGVLAVQTHLNMFPSGTSANGAEYEAHTADLLTVVGTLERRCAELLAVV